MKTIDGTVPPHKYIVLAKNKAGVIGIRPAIDDEHMEDTETEEVRVRVESKLLDDGNCPESFYPTNTPPLHYSVAIPTDEVPEMLEEALEWLNNQPSKKKAKYTKKTLTIMGAKLDEPEIASEYVARYGDGWV